MVRRFLADAGQQVLHLDALRLQHLAIADARQLQDLHAADAAGAQQHLAARAHRLDAGRREHLGAGAAQRRRRRAPASGGAPARRSTSRSSAGRSRSGAGRPLAVFQRRPDFWLTSVAHALVAAAAGSRRWRECRPAARPARRHRECPSAGAGARPATRRRGRAGLELGAGLCGVLGIEPPVALACCRKAAAVLPAPGRVAGQPAHWS